MAALACGIMMAHRSIPNRLPLSPKLRERLARWCVRFQRSFEREIDLDAFAAEGP